MEYHVIYSRKGWRVLKRESRRVTAVCKTKGAAIIFSIVAIKELSRLLIHNRDGTVELSWSPCEGAECIHCCNNH